MLAIRTSPGAPVEGDFNAHGRIDIVHDMARLDYLVVFIICFRKLNEFSLPP